MAAASTGCRRRRSPDVRAEAPPAAARFLRPSLPAPPGRPRHVRGRSRRRLFLPAPPSRPRRLRPRHGRALRAGGLRRASRAPRQRRHAAARRPRLGLRSPGPDRRLQPRLQRQQPQPQGQVERVGSGSHWARKGRGGAGACTTPLGARAGWGPSGSLFTRDSGEPVDDSWRVVRAGWGRKGQDSRLGRVGARG